MNARYKNSEFGEIPADWKILELREISSSQSVGLVVNPSTYFEKRGTVPMLVGSCVSENSIAWQDANMISEASNSSLPASRLSAGDIVVVRVGEPGTAAVIPQELDGCNCASMMIVRQGKSFDSSWLCFAMNSIIGTNQISSVQYGTAQKQFNISDAVAFRFPVPTMPEQKAIAETLSDVDGLIAGLEALIAKKRDLKTATMQQLLTGKTRLPGFGEGVGMKQTELGEIPEDWDLVSLGSIGTPVIGLTYKPSDVVEDGTLVLRSSNIQNERLAYENNVFVGSDVPNRVIANEGDLLICVRNGSRALIGKCALIDKHADGSAFGAFMSLFKSEHSRFVYFQFKSRMIKKQIEDTMGATINQITNKDLNRFCIPFPPEDEERSEVVAVLSEFEADIWGLEGQLEKYKALKQGMMQELLTGRTRLI